jgi:hypothetical protein
MSGIKSRVLTSNNSWRLTPINKVANGKPAWAPVHGAPLALLSSLNHFLLNLYSIVDFLGIGGMRASSLFEL